MPRIRLTVKPSGGLFAFTEQHPDAEFSILSAYPTEDALLVILKAGIESPGAVIGFFEASELISDFEVRHEEDDRVVVAYALPFVPPPIRAIFDAGELPRFPVSIKNGQVHAEMTTSHDRISRFKAGLDAADVPFEVVSVTQAESLEERLTGRQTEFVRIALKRGYYDTPRRCTLTDVADEVGVTPATASTVLHRAEETIIKNSVVDEAIFV